MRPRTATRSLLLLAALATPVTAQPPDADKSAPAREARRLEGAWLAKYLVTDDGVEPYPLPGRGLVFTDGTFARTEGRRLVQAGAFRLDPAKGHLDLLVEERNPWDAEAADATRKVPETLECSYRVVGDLLTVGHGIPGKQRPADLKAGKGRTVVVYERQKEPAPSPKAGVGAAPQPLDGAWVVESFEPAELPGVVIPNRRVARTVWVVDGATWTCWSDGVLFAQAKGDFPLGGPADRITFTIKSVPSGPGSIDGQRWTGVWKRDGNRLRLCVDVTGREFPGEFAAPPESTRRLYVMARAKGPVPDARPAGGIGAPAKFEHAALERFQGRWRMTGWEVGGGKLPADEVKARDLVLVIEGNNYTVLSKGAKGTFGRLAVDATQSPPTLLFMNTDREQDAYTWCVYDLAGDDLRICRDARGRGRPAEIRATESTVVHTYRRVR